MKKAALWIWIPRWEEFQTFHKKRGKPWTPPWIKTYLAQMDDPRYLELTDRQRALLHDLRCMHGTSRMRTRYDHVAISKRRNVRTYRSDLEALYHAGLIDLCPGTVLEQRRAAFWNRSNLEVEVEVEEEEDLDLRPLPGLDQTGKTVDIDQLSKHLLKDIPR